MKVRMIQTVFVLCFLSMNLFAGVQEDLFTACKQMDLAGVQKAVADGADVKALDEAGNSAISVSFFSPDITRYLLDKGCDPNSGKYPALIQACNAYSVEVAEMLIKAGADPNKKGVIDPSDTFRALVAAEKAKGSKANKMLIKAWSANIGKLPTSETTALQQTVQQTNCVPCLKLLLDNGAKLDVSGETTILHILATFSNTAKTRRDLFAKGAPMMSKFGLKTPGWYSNIPDSINGSQTEMLDLLLMAKPDLDVKDKNGYTPLNMALNLKKPEIAKGLLKAGADVTIPYKYMTITKYPVTFAAYLGDAEIMKMIVEKGVDLSVETWEMDKFSNDFTKGFTPLIISVMNDCLGCARVLIENGAKPANGVNGHIHIKNIDCTFRVKNKSAIFFAIENNNAEMVQLMMDSFSFWSNNPLEMKAPINKQNYSGERCNFLAGGKFLPGMYAKKLGYKEIAELLAAKGL